MVLKKIFSQILPRTKRIVGKSSRKFNDYIVIMLVSYFFLSGVVDFSGGKMELAGLKLLVAAMCILTRLAEKKAEQMQDAVEEIEMYSSHIIRDTITIVDQLQTENKALENIIKKLDRRVLEKSGIHLEIEKKPKELN
jgi:hypothetical protein